MILSSKSNARNRAVVRSCFYKWRKKLDHLSGNSQSVANDQTDSVTFLRIGGKDASWVAAVDARYKLVLSVNDNPWLFDSKQDPDELQNLYGRSGTEGVSKRLAMALRKYREKTGDPHLQNKNHRGTGNCVDGECGAREKPPRNESVG